MKKIAPFSLRILSGLVDALVILMAYQLVILYIVSANNLTQILDSLLFGVFLAFLIYPIIFPLFSAFMISTMGATIGKLATNTRIVNNQGQLIGFWRSLLRNYLGYMVSGTFFWLGFIWVGIDKERRGWHDMIAETWVVVKNSGGLITGMLAFILFLIINVVMLGQSVQKYKLHKPYYAEIISQISAEFTDFNKEDALPEMSPSPEIDYRTF